MAWDPERESVSFLEYLYEFCTAIDEEITSTIKNFEADQKRLRAIMVNFEEKKPEMSEGERQERQ